LEARHVSPRPVEPKPTLVFADELTTIQDTSN
jgi:hypothetical protein